ncbi:MAG: hypothetical protein EP343_26735 [Deltaproteobacteria bacterium]|nr:MAG: hypothetical protein EP343_26735 [Deltaproteobacteria bacterium]
MKMRLAWLFFLCCGIGLGLGFGCGDGLPQVLSVCSKAVDCSPGQLCIRNVCVSQLSVTQTETADIESSGESVEPGAEASQDIASEPVKEVVTEPQADGGTTKDDSPADDKPTEVVQPDGSAEDVPDATETVPETPAEVSPELPTEPTGECKDGEQRVCYEGPKGSESKGVCKTGTQTCVSGKWGQCNGQILPQTELCGNGRDDDCDGAPDENCPCNYDGKNVGVCKTAMTDGSGNCQKPKDYSLTDVCGDGIDNDCNGNTDETCECKAGETKDCGSDVGECKKGTQKCGQNGKWEACTGETKPVAEVCGDKKDNNCDGVVDENCPCNYLGKKDGVCATAKNDKSGVCVKPSDYLPTDNCADLKDNNCDGHVNKGCPCNYLKNPLGVCANQTRGDNNVCPKPADYSTTEKCDGKDNDCNGVVDEGCPCNYLGKTKGVCTQAKRNSQGSCAPPADYNPNMDSCADSLDNNCDGQVNEGCVCRSNDQQKCGSDVGECKQGTQTCTKLGQWGTCQGEVKPVAEICGDQKDNNCDGVVDEGCPCNYLDKGAGVCKGLKRNAQGVCEKPAKYSTSEICGDNVDNDCDNKLEEQCPCNYNNLSAGVCASAVKDNNGVCQQPSDYDPSSNEPCDGKDNNCNGVVDEGCPCNYLNKNAGVCKTAKLDSRGVCAQPTGYSATELCDGLDNDCDGQVDVFPIGSCYTTVTCTSVPTSGTDAIAGTFCLASRLECKSQNSKPVCTGFYTSLDCKSLSLAQCSQNVACPAACPTLRSKIPTCTSSGYCQYK